MTEAVLDLVAAKFGPGGSYDAAHLRPWTGRDGGSVAPPDERAVEATIAFCEYVFATYGRFPAHEDAFKALIAFQAHHVDAVFYDAFYPKDSLPQAQREHGHIWHAEEQWSHESVGSTNKEGMR